MILEWVVWGLGLFVLNGGFPIYFFFYIGSLSMINLMIGMSDTLLDYTKNVNSNSCESDNFFANVKLANLRNAPDQTTSE